WVRANLPNSSDCVRSQRWQRCSIDLPHCPRMTMNCPPITSPRFTVSLQNVWHQPGSKPPLRSSDLHGAALTLSGFCLCPATVSGGGQRLTSSSAGRAMCLLNSEPTSRSNTQTYAPCSKHLASPNTPASSTTSASRLKFSPTNRTASSALRPQAICLLQQP